MATLSSRTGLSPVDTTIALANNATTTIQNMSAYNHQELVGHVEIVASSTYRAAVKVTVVKNGAGTYEVSGSDISGDDNSGNPIVSFSMSGSNLQATLVSYGGFTSASIRYHLQHAVTNANYPLSIDGGQILSGTVAAARLPLATGSSQGVVPYYEEGSFTTSEVSKTNMGGTGVYPTGRYVRVGNVLHASIQANITGYTITTAASRLILTCSTNLPLCTYRSTGQCYIACTTSPNELIPSNVTVLPSGGQTRIEVLGMQATPGVVNGDSVVIYDLTFTVIY
jgi:hypothetical protein